MSQIAIQRPLLDFQDVFRSVGRKPTWGCDRPRYVAPTPTDHDEHWHPCGGCQSCRINWLIRKALRVEAREKKAVGDAGS